MRTSSVHCLVLLAAVGIVAAMIWAGVGLSDAQPSQSDARGPRRVTMEELHGAGGVPRGWKFTVPPGDPAKGRQLFADLECYKCHVIKGELLPADDAEPASRGPELTGMGSEHPAEYIAESILAPNHVIMEGPGYSGPDGLSTMPGFTDSLSLAQWLDLVAYLKTLAGVSDAPHAGHEIEREQLAGDYRLRLVYLPPGHEGAAGHSHPGGRGSARAPAVPGRLSLFVTDREFDEPVPYLPVTATVQAQRRPTERLRLGPRMGEQGFHYGIDVTLPPRTQKLTVSIGPTTVPLVKDKFTKVASVVFEWEPAGR